ncbi:hypothetical protein I7G86_19435 [Sinorhizobium meliloti]|uniref:hypothetical protein n=1 Tax=Rhizobium meliloti TaxID=382 RepID=UPI00030BFAB3|nr:hypothetical protein [Sinorhizobium meliloti]ARS67273.1 hypothetical protein SMRU11_08840 [Sinorhizobium meliloti RU11/001]MDE3763937.1 hypothetical protein [Sinorhizobium meliloti]MDE3776299.1 hypothetical protein [Sinorhizobium meliloti]MDE3792799.1 hypothetical protein [Sinorhizobium meliloti]MDE3805031.1 hypothetical protein [Sinorhizobium meliloti]
MNEAQESEILQAWCDGNLTLEYAAGRLDIAPEAVIELAKERGFKLPLRADLELRRLRDVNYRANHGVPGE